MKTIISKQTETSAIREKSMEMRWYRKILRNIFIIIRHVASVLSVLKPGQRSAVRDALDGVPLGDEAFLFGTCRMN